jgi:hypothetical protein
MAPWWWQPKGSLQICNPPPLPGSRVNFDRGDGRDTTALRRLRRDLAAAQSNEVAAFVGALVGGLDGRAELAFFRLPGSGLWCWCPTGELVRSRLRAEVIRF